MTLAPGYDIVQGTPSVDDYLRLREESGLTPRRREQAEAGLTGSWTACFVVDQASGEVVGMGRIIGDGGWYFHIIDMAVLPQHQRKGLGDAILTWLLTAIDERAPKGAFVSLMADPPGRPLYEKHGFSEQRDRTMGMAQFDRLK